MKRKTLYLSWKTWRGFIALQENDHLFLPLSIKLHRVQRSHHLRVSGIMSDIDGAIGNLFPWPLNAVIQRSCCCRQPGNCLLVLKLLVKFHCRLPCFHCYVPKLPFPHPFGFFYVPFTHLCLICLYLHTCIFAPWTVLIGCVVLLRHFQETNGWRDHKFW